ncbi:MAG: thiamine phosphate synthase [Sphingorhabdus sp.]
MRIFQQAKLALPRIWLMSDERLGDDFLGAIKRLPFSSGIIFRHYSLDDTQRRKLYREVRRIAKRRGHVILLSGDVRVAIRWHADGVHDRGRRQRVPVNMIHAAPVHNLQEMAEAKRAGADMILLSPLYPTASHSGAAALGQHGFAQLTGLAPMPVIALGGMNRRRGAMLDKRRVHGWAAISAFYKKGK